MEKSPARVTRDLSAPWLRHLGRDDGLGGRAPRPSVISTVGSLWRPGHGTTGSLSLPCLFDYRFAFAPPSFRLQVRYRSLVFSTVGSAGTGMEKSPARDD